MKLVSLALAAALAAAVPVSAQPLSTSPAAVPAIDGILAAFQTHRLVALGDDHNVAQLFDFWNALVRDPRFARDVGNVVVEFGGEADQAVIDRYVDGQEVPYADFRKILTDAPGWGPVVPYLGYANFFAQVRTVNLGLARDQRIHVWLGEPAIDWTKINTKAEFDAIVRTREAHAADVIAKNILAKNRKALVIYGGGHLERRPAVLRTAARPGSEALARTFLAGMTQDPPDYGTLSDAFAKFVQNGGPGVRNRLIELGPVRSIVFRDTGHDPGGSDGFDIQFANGAQHMAIFIDAGGKIAGAGFSELTDGLLLADLLDVKQPGALFIIQPYMGFGEKGCAERFAPTASAWKAPSLVTPDPRTKLGQAMAGCTPRAWAPDDALLYIGPPEQLVVGPNLPDTYLDLGFRKELARRTAIIAGSANYAAPPKMEGVPMTPLHIFP